MLAGPCQFPRALGSRHVNWGLGFSGRALGCEGGPEAVKPGVRL